jgi:hypothetical protein
MGFRLVSPFRALTSRVSSRAKALILLATLSLAPVIVLACSNSPSRERVGSSVNAVVSANTSWSATNTTIPINNVWNVQTAAGHYFPVGGIDKTMRQITAFEGKFNGTVGVGWMTRDEDTAPSTPQHATTASSSFGAPTLAGGGAATAYVGPTAVAYLNKDGDGTVTENQWMIASYATSSSGGADIVISVTNNGAQGSTPWTSSSLTGQLLGDNGALPQPGTIVLAVDPSLTYFPAFDYGNATSVAGNYHAVYAYFTSVFAANTGPDAAAGVPYLTEQIAWLFVDSTGTPFLAGQIQDKNGGCPIGTTIVDSGLSYCIDTTFAANTLNLVVGYQNASGCTYPTSGTYLYASWAATNPYGQTLSPNCPITSGSTTFTQKWWFTLLWAPTSAAYVWSGFNIITDTAAPYCIGDQTNWPKPALAFDPTSTNESIAMAVAKSGGANGGTRIHYFQTSPIGCLTDGGTTTIAEGTQTAACAASAGNTDKPCQCGSTSCQATPPTYETDQILPALAYDHQDNGTDNFLTSVWYDNTHQAAGVSAFGSLVGQATSGTNADKPSSLSGLVLLSGPVQEVDASAPLTKQIGIAPLNTANHFYSAMHGSNEVVNSQYTSN